MRITKEMLIKSAKDTVTMRIKSEKDLVAAYLVGSVLGDEPLLGGHTDIDLILVHANLPQAQREIVRVYDEVHLDIQHHPQSLYLQPRELRADPWLGYTIQNHPQLLYDVRHWFEFTQASVGSQFYRPDHAADRSRKLKDQARSLWADLQQTKKPHAERVRSYLMALECAGNAIASLSGPPLTKRRFSSLLLSRFKQIGVGDLYSGFAFLTGITDVNTETIQSLFPLWEQAYKVAGQQESCPMDLHPLRRDYYLECMKTMLVEEEPDSVSMPLLRTWNKAILTTLSTTPEYDAWLQSMSTFHLGKEDMPERINSLDHFLDRLDEVLDTWSAENGA